MPLTFTTEVRNAVVAREKACAWFLEMYCDEGTLRAWDQFETISYGGDTFEPMGVTGEIVGDLKSSADLVSEPLSIRFNDSGLIDTTLVGRLVRRSWHRRRMQLRCVVFNVTSNFFTPIGTVFDWVGKMDTIENPEGSSSEAMTQLTAYSGTFLARGRNLTTVTDADQKRRDATDASFKNIAVKPFQDVPFGVGWSTIPGVQTTGGGQLYTPPGNNATIAFS